MEEWRDIKGYEGYQVSNLGNVRSLDRWITYKNGGKRFWKGKTLKPNLIQGYLYVFLYKKEAKPKIFRIHRLVAEAFIPNPDNLPQVNHINERKTDNRVENLEYCNARYNLNYKNGQKRRGEKRKKSVAQFDLNNNYITTYPSIKEASLALNKNHTGIMNCLKGTAKTAYGFKWYYAA